MTSLFQRFIFVAGGLVLLLSIGLHEYSRSVETSQLIELERRRGESAAKVLANAVSRHGMEFLGSAVKLNNEELKTSAALQSIDGQVRGMLAGSNIEKVKIFSTEGRTIYSSLEQDIGKSKSAQVDFGNVIRSAQSASVFEHRRTFESIHGTKNNRDIVSVYVPVLGADRNIVAVFEIYTDITDEFGLLARQRLITSILVVTLLTAGFAVLLFVLRSSARTIDAQAQELAKFNEKLEAGIAESTHALFRHQSLLTSLTGDDLYRSRDLALSLGRIAEVMAEGLQATRTSIWIANDAHAKLCCLDVYDAELDRHQDGPVVDLGACSAYWLAMRRQKIITATEPAEDRMFGGLSGQLADMPMLASVMDTPIIVDNHLVGVLRAESTNRSFYWSPEAQVFTLSLANLATLAVERSERRQIEAELINANKNHERLLKAV